MTRKKKVYQCQGLRSATRTGRYAELANSELRVSISFNVNKRRHSHLNLRCRDHLTPAADPLSCRHVVFRQRWVAENNVNIINASKFKD